MHQYVTIKLVAWTHLFSWHTHISVVQTREEQVQASGILTKQKCNKHLFRKQCYSLSTFRCASHTLHIEVGRHTGAEKSKRLCSHYLLYNNLRVVDCEYHAFFHCTKHSDIRETYLFSWYVLSRDLVSILLFFNE